MQCLTTNISNALKSDGCSLSSSSPKMWSSEDSTLSNISILQKFSNVAREILFSFKLRQLVLLL